MHDPHKQLGQQVSPLEREAIQKTHTLITRANRELGLSIPLPVIRFDLRGQTAGMVKYPRGGPALIRYNLKLLEQNREHFLAQTLPHEVAHVVAPAKFGRRIRPHGPEWQSLMLYFGAKPKRCHNYDVSKLPTRKLKRFNYRCNCRDHQLTSIRHNRVIRGQTYLCRSCATPLLQTS